MPTYEYVCTSCDAPIEVVQSIHEPALTECPSCSDGRLRKVFGNVGVVFKGSGFYRTDSRSKPKGSGQSASQPTKPKPAGATSSSDGTSSRSDAPAAGSGTSSTDARPSRGSAATSSPRTAAST